MIESPQRPMPPSPDLDPRALQAAAAALDVALSDVQAAQLAAYARLLLRWNDTHNLTAIRDIDEVITHHLMDSLALVAPLRRLGLTAARLLDVGTGGGLPGVPLALSCPELSVTLLDAVQKKCAFLTQVKIELRQPNLEVVHARVERWQAPPFAVIVARAFASLRDFVTVSRHLLAPDGVWLAMKGPGLEPELTDLPDGIVVDEIVPLTVPGLAETRRLVVLRQAIGGET